VPAAFSLGLLSLTVYRLSRHGHVPVIAPAR
jgi:hypothetical protein